MQKCKGVLAVPNIRGGGELGKEWHLAGTRERKVRKSDCGPLLEVTISNLSYRSIVLMTSSPRREYCFPKGARPFAQTPSSEYLVKNKYAAADKLTLNGGSNGGMNDEDCIVFVWYLD